jgi:hypothetical protein
VNYAFGVRGIQGIGDLNAQIQNSVEGQRFFRNQMLESFPLEQFHGDESLILALVNFMDGADVGMIQSGGRASLAPKAFEGLPIVSYIFGQKLQGHESAEARVLGFVYNTHAATTEPFDDAVV